MKINQDKTINSRTDFFYYTFRNILLVGLPLVLISAFILYRLSLHSSALEDSSDKVNLTIPVSCNLTATIPSGKEHTISMVSGTYEDEIGETILKASCNDANGYVVYAIGNTDNTEGKNVLSTMIGSTYDIPTGTATSGDTSAWAMKLSPIASSNLDTPTMEPGYNSYHTIPNTWTKVVSKSSNTDISEGSSFSTTYAIYLKNAQPAGTYSGQVKYVMFHPSTTAAPTDTIEHAFAAAGKQKITIYDDNGTNTTESTSPTTGENSTLIGSFYKMQDIDSNICNNTTLVDEQNTLQLVDIRDYKIYWVTKLQDGHCWMTQNLDLDIGIKDTTLGIDTTVLTSNDTDLNDNSLSGAYQLNYTYDHNTKIISWTPKNSTINFTTTAASWTNANAEARSANNLNDINTGHSSIGNYYNWSAAIASDNSTILSASTRDNIRSNPQNSICPKGWRLPTISNQDYTTAGSTNEFARLNYLYNDNLGDNDSGLISAPLYFLKSGLLKTSSKSIEEFSNEGFYSSSTNQSIWDISYLYFNSTRVWSNRNTYGADGGKYYGWSLRCLAR